MPIPDYQSLMLPVLQTSEYGEIRIADAVSKLANTLGLSPEESSELLPSGNQTVFNNRVHWARFYLIKAGLLESTRRGYFKITERGKQVLSSNKERIDNEFLKQIPDFQQFLGKRTQPKIEGGDVDDKETPDEIMRATHRQIDAALAQELLDRIYAAPPAFFERLIVNLLLSMGFGGSATAAGRAIGRSGDDGVDGVIDQDALGLDRVYIQAKRYAVGNNIGAGAIRDFCLLAVWSGW